MKTSSSKIKMATLNAGPVVVAFAFLLSCSNAPSISPDPAERQQSVSADRLPNTAREHLTALAAEIQLFEWSLAMSGENDALYFPDTSAFRSNYDLDAENQVVQTWDQYSGWVETFYKGRLLVHEGWKKSSERLLAAVNSPDVLLYLNVIGRVVAAEWSKDNGVRKIDTNDVKSWNAELEKNNNDIDLIPALRTTADQIADKLK